MKQILNDESKCQDNDEVLEDSKVANFVEWFGEEMNSFMTKFNHGDKLVRLLSYTMVSQLPPPITTSRNNIL